MIAGHVRLHLTLRCLQETRACQRCDLVASHQSIGVAHWPRCASCSPRLAQLPARGTRHGSLVPGRIGSRHPTRPASCRQNAGRRVPEAMLPGTSPRTAPFGTSHPGLVSGRAAGRCRLDERVRAVDESRPGLVEVAARRPGGASVSRVTQVILVIHFSVPVKLRHQGERDPDPCNLGQLGNVHKRARPVPDAVRVRARRSSHGAVGALTHRRVAIAALATGRCGTVWSSGNEVTTWQRSRERAARCHARLHVGERARCRGPRETVRS